MKSQFPPPLPRKKSERRGNAAFTAVTALTMLGFSSLVVDIGYARMVKAQLQNGIDAAAHAGVSQIIGAAVETDAIETAQAFGLSNYANGSTIVLNNNQCSGSSNLDCIEVGVYTTNTGFQAEPHGGTAHSNHNAIRIRKQVPVNTIFGLAAFGTNLIGAGASTTVLKPAPQPATAVSCFLPIAVPVCAVMSQIGDGDMQFEPGENPVAPLDFRTSDAHADSGGWASLVGSANVNFVRDQLTGSTCTGAAISNTTQVALQNGAGTNIFEDLSYMLRTGATKDGLTSGNFPVGEWNPEYWNTANAGPVAWNDRILPQDCDNDGSTGESKNNVTDDDNDCDGDRNKTESGFEESKAESDFGGVGATEPARWGNVIEGPVMLIGGDFCGTNPPQFNQGQSLVGFAWGAIYDVAYSGGHSEFALRLNVDYDFSDYATSGGNNGVEYGLVYQQPPMSVE